MSLSRQVAIALAVPVAMTVLLVAIAALALNRVIDVKDTVIERDARLVIDAHRLDLAVSDRSVAVRNFLLTGDQRYLQSIERANDDYGSATAALASNVHTNEGRRLLHDIDRANDQLLDVVADALEVRRAGAVGPDDLATIIEDQLGPARAVITGLIDQLVDRQQLLIDDAIAASDRTAANTTWLLVALGLAGAVLAAAIGAWITRRVASRVTGLALSVDTATAEILAGTAQQAAGATQQAASVQETVATADELAQTADETASRSRTVADRAHEAADVAERGTEAVGQSVEAMQDIRDQVGSIADSVVALAERNEAISGIVRSVEDIAEQIHLLALNASIEAARAGEGGRGFAVVASEVRALADQSRQATLQVAQILGEIQQRSNAAVMATEQGGKSVDAGARSIEITGTTIDELAETVASAAMAAEQISASAGQQAVATAQISHAMRDLEGVAQQNSAAARQAEEAARDLSGVARSLKSLVGA